MNKFFATIPETTLPGGLVVPAFQVSRYACSCNGDGSACIDPQGMPLVRISYHDAVIAAEAAGFQLERESQRVALAYQIAAQDGNWTGGKVGKGMLFQGLRKYSVSGPVRNDYEPLDSDERRWFVLPDGSRIYDVAGHLFNWTFDDIHGNSRGLIDRPFKRDDADLVIPFPTENKGQGWLPTPGSNWSGDALVRGGYWISYANAGVFRLSSGVPDRRDDDVGFRVTKGL